MFALSAVLVAVVVTVQGIATWGMLEDLNRLLSDPAALEDLDSPGGLDTLTSTVQSGLLGYGISTAASFLITTVLTGLLIHSVSQSVIGRKMSLGQVWAAVRGQILRLLGLSLVIGLILMVISAVAIGLVTLAATTGEPGVIALVGIVVVLTAFVSMIAVVVFTVLATPVLVLERSGIITALRRSFQLTRRSFWRILGIYLLTVLLVGILASVVSYPFGIVGGLIGSLMAIQVASMVGQVISLAVTTPFMAAVTALLYIDVRIRTEALDVELARAAEAA
ncbi:DUF7544 domain-containing protein [Ruania alba]|nr:glycerophosphoryl diester phosphodiesterase membrane domain-containing protein [Ruania alba]